MRVNFALAILSLIGCSVSTQAASAQDALTGFWNAELDCPGGPLRFGIQIDEIQNEDPEKSFSGFLVNGPERIKIPSLKFDGKSGVVDIPHYDSRITFALENDTEKISGEWRKRRGAQQWSSLPFSATKLTTPIPTQSKKQAQTFTGRWEVQFKSDTDPSVALFQVDQATNRIIGTFLTTTGDYRYLDSRINGGVLELSCFDGAHAFLFHIQKTGENKLAGDFWSSGSWHDTFEASRNDTASLPDAFKQTVNSGDELLGQLSFPDLDGKPTRLDDPQFDGKVRIIYVFGSWCPNCHDAAAYFAELNKKYGEQGLSILGLAFEHTGDFERDSEQVRRYLERHQCSYPVLIAGLSDKKEASKAIPILDRIRSYPTTLFLDSSNKVRAIHTGFTGPATGNDFLKQKQKFESLIESIIAESHQ